MTVFLLIPVMREMLRIEQPSTSSCRQSIAFSIGMRMSSSGFLRFDEGLSALKAAESLIAFPVVAETLRDGATVMAGHCGFPLESHTGKADNEVARLARLRLCGLSPDEV